MKRLVINILVLLFFITTASKCKNEATQERNGIRFNQSLMEVERKLHLMNSLMDNLVPNEGQLRNYFFDNESNLYVNNRNLGKIEGLNTLAIEMFRNFTDEEKEDFIDTILFLNDNYITSVFQDKSCRCYLYNYHAVEDNSFDTDRLIYLEEEGKTYETILVDREIIDRNGNLILIRAK